MINLPTVEVVESELGGAALEPAPHVMFCDVSSDNEAGPSSRGFFSRLQIASFWNLPIHFRWQIRWQHLHWNAFLDNGGIDEKIDATIGLLMKRLLKKIHENIEDFWKDW